MPHKSKNVLLQYDRSQIPIALQKIQMKEMTIRGASRQYGIPYSTLRDRTAGRIPANAHPGISTVLTKYEEDNLTEYIIKCADMGVGKSMQQVKEMAAMIVHKDPHRSHVAELWATKMQAGNDWYYAFLKRHPQLSLRTPEKLSQVRAKMTNEAVLTRFYDTLWSPTYLTKHLHVSLMQMKLAPLDFKPHKVVALKKTRSLYSLNSGDKTQVTVLACGNAAGNMIPPAVIFPGKRVNNVLVESAPQGWYVQFTESGWIRSVAFEKWFGNLFIPYINKHVRPHNKEQKVVLILDGHKSHETLRTLKEAQENYVDIICLPPNTTHLLQPLDITFFKSLKCHWNRENEAYCRENHGEFVKKGSFMKVFQKSWDKCCQKTGVVSNGFKRVGIAPYKRLTLGDIQSDKILFPSAGLNTPLQTTSPVVSASTSESELHVVEAPPETNQTGSNIVVSASTSESELVESPPETNQKGSNSPVVSASTSESELVESPPETNQKGSNSPVVSASTSESELVESPPETNQKGSNSPVVSASTSESELVESPPETNQKGSNSPVVSASTSKSELVEAPPETNQTAGSNSPRVSASTSESELVEAPPETNQTGLNSPHVSASTSESEFFDLVFETLPVVPARINTSPGYSFDIEISPDSVTMSSCLELFNNINESLGNSVPPELDKTQILSSEESLAPATNAHQTEVESDESPGTAAHTEAHQVDAHLNTIFKLPSFTHAPKRVRKTNPYCRVLTSNEVILEKERMMDQELEKLRIRKEKEERKAKVAKEKVEKANEKLRIRKEKEEKKAKAAKEKFQKAKEKAKTKKMQAAKKAREKAKTKQLQVAKKATENAKSKKLKAVKNAKGNAKSKKKQTAKKLQEGKRQSQN
ncbi:LOW QUALITY PROTEIN: uncharacterized protein [Amphiura filiformis]|uniref:LOW QUALITY PROTEIN: uncharacterized protein n=1 Tax=Amphiura filiformis TaxID=82378 RepID=UPI003B225BFC